MEEESRSLIDVIQQQNTPLQEAQKNSNANSESKKARDAVIARAGKNAAKGFIHNHTVFPTDDCFTIKDEENSFSSFLRKTFHDDSEYRQEENFRVLVSSNRSVWYTSCNQVRGDLIYKTKDRYFGEFEEPTCSFMTVPHAL